MDQNNEYRIEDGVLYLELSGKLDKNSADELREKFNRICAEAEFSGICIDMNALSGISSAGLSVLLAMKKSLMGGSMRAENVNSVVMQLFEDTGFDSFIETETAAGGNEIAVSNANFSKWVACWGTATSITERKEAIYAKDITFRYPIHLCFNGSKIRVHFSNLTGTEDVVLNKAFADKIPLTVNGKKEIKIKAGKEILTDEIEYSARKGGTVYISFYLKNFTQMNAGTLVTGPLSGGGYAYGDFADKNSLPDELSNTTQWYYFLNTVDVYTEAKNYAVCCYGDSITAQDWPDYLQLELEKRRKNDIAVIRRAVCGTRILRQYDCIAYQSYGLKGETRFPIETNIAGLKTVIIQHGINDIIHPVGVEVNKFRPMTDMPVFDELKDGVENFYVSCARANDLKVISGTLLPIYGWRTYSEDKEALRKEFNEWLRTSKSFDGCIDFDKAVRDENQIEKFGEGYDSGDHLHPSQKAYMKMAEVAADML